MATPTTERWTSRFSFLMIGIGAAVGLGNLWRFPFQAGENGGSAFVLVYLLCIVVIVYPVLIGELAVGRHMGLSAVGSTKEMANNVAMAGSGDESAASRRPLGQQPACELLRATAICLLHLCKE